MKKFVIICIAVCLLFAAYESRIELPPADNTTLAEELITHTYSDADLALIEENYDNILDLARDYKIECIRDPNRKSTRLNSSHLWLSRMPSSA